MKTKTLAITKPCYMSLFILLVAMIYSMSAHAGNVSAGVPHWVTKSVQTPQISPTAKAKLIHIAKGQAYVPPQKRQTCQCEC